MTALQAVAVLVVAFLCAHAIRWARERRERRGVYCETCGDTLTS